MSYLRSPFYIWGDSASVHIWPRTLDEQYQEYVKDCGFPLGISLPEDIFDFICLCRVAQLETNDDIKNYSVELLQKYGGNFGSADLYRSCGINPPWVSHD